MAWVPSMASTASPLSVLSVAEGERGLQGQLLGQVGGADPFDHRGEGRVVVENSIHCPAASAAWEELSPARSLEAVGVPLDVGDVADHQNGDGALPQEDRLAGRSRPRIPALLQGLLGFGRRRGVVDRPGAGGGECVLVEGRGAGGGRGGRRGLDHHGHGSGNGQRLKAAAKAAAEQPAARRLTSLLASTTRPPLLPLRPGGPSASHGRGDPFRSPIARSDGVRAGGRPTVLRRSCPAGARIHVLRTRVRYAPHSRLGAGVTPPP